jgi:hypothetical protein
MSSNGNIDNTSNKSKKTKRLNIENYEQITCLTEWIIELRGDGRTEAEIYDRLCTLFNLSKQLASLTILPNK